MSGEPGGREGLRLALMVTSTRYMGVLRGLLGGAKTKGVELACFITGDGVRVLSDPQTLESLRTGAARLGVCELSWEREEMGPHIDGINYGSQYQNSEFLLWADKVMVL